jgi:Protein of unknown function (DUF3558)
VRYRRAVPLAPLPAAAVIVTVVLVTAALAAGCTTVVAGMPSAPPGVLLPPRPREVRLNGVDPCSLLTAEQRASLDLTSAPRLSSSRVELFNGDVPTCTVRRSGPSAIVLGIGTVTTVGIERWWDPALRADVRPTRVADFPAVVAIPSNSRAYCSVEVDVAPGQLLDVQVLDGGYSSPIPQATLCDRAEEYAWATMQTLLKP